MTVNQQIAPDLEPHTERLSVLRELFDRLHEAGIRYCHWKSNQHLEASLIGATDVDVLVDRRSIVSLTRILGESNFKRLVVKPGLGYPGIEDYVGFDAPSGKLTHFHVHYQLTLGEKFLKGHRLPWEELALETRVRDEAHDVYVCEPHLELLTLIVRAGLKARLRDSFQEMLGRPFFRGGMLRELRWLVNRTEPARLVALATELVGPRSAQLIPEILAAPYPTIRQLQAFRRRANPALREYRLYGYFAAKRRMMMRELSLVWWRLKHWYVGSPGRSTRTLPQGGAFIAFLGADGAGKSTLTKVIADWLSSDVAVATTYGGSGKGSASLPRRVLQGVGGALRTVGRSQARATSGAPSTRERPLKLWAVGRLIWVLTLNSERRRRALFARKARARGMVLLTDRLPQRQFPGWNDGTRLTRWLDRPRGLRRWLAEWEQATFRLVELTPPELVVKLHVSLARSLERKPETPEEQLRRGIELTKGLRFPPTSTIVDVDADQPLATVVQQVKRAVWECL